MNAAFWQRVHGGSTHFPMVLLLASAVFDVMAGRTRDDSLRRGLRAAGFGSATVGVLAAVAAVLAGLAMTRGRTLGSGYERMHHLFVWPGFTTSVVLVAWRYFRRGIIPERVGGVYLAGMFCSSLLMMGAGYWGGEMLLATEPETPPMRSSTEGQSIAMGKAGPGGDGRQLFLKNCAHCHGADGHGDDGPDLHNLDWPEEQITARIKNGKKGQMTAFNGKLSAEQTRQITRYVRSLK